MDREREALECYVLSGVQETGRELGTGSYAAVVEVHYKGLQCAGKKVHCVLYEQGAGNLISHVEEACRLLSQLRHPHIVQFMGIYFESETNMPVLVTEFLPTNLAQCLDNYGVLPEELSYSILRDVALGLRYLHDRSQPVVHCDLSANNVLLSRDMRAKISDVGMTKLIHLNSTRTAETIQSPGTYLYTPPEALFPSPCRDTKLDIFSYGVMMVHVFTGHWPLPGEPAKANPQNPNHPLIPVSEADRREEYLGDVGRDHPLMELILRCLHNSPALRPEAAEILRHVSEIASHFPPSFANQAEMLKRIKSESDQKDTLKAESQRSRRSHETIERKLWRIQWQSKS